LVRRALKAPMSQAVDYTVPFGTAWAVALDATHLYFSHEKDGAGWVRRCALGDPGCGPDEDLTGGFATTGPRNVVVDASYVYWTDNLAGLVRMRAKESMTGPSLIASGQTNPHGLIATKHCLYWRDDKDNGRIFTVRKHPPGD
jgi:hypothetical protein